MTLTGFKKTLLSSLLLTAIVGCENGVDNERLDRDVPPPPAPIVRGDSAADQALFSAIETQTVVLNVHDAKTDLPIQGNLRFNIDEVNNVAAIALSDNVTAPSLANGATYEFVSDTGSLTLQLDETLEDSMFPIVLRVQVEADGYFASGKTVYIQSSDQSLLESIQLSSKTAPPEGVVIGQVSGEIGAGGLNQTLELSAGADTDEAVGEFAIVTGNELKDADGSSLKSGPVKIEVAYFDPQTENVDELFPGGVSFEADTDAQGVSNGGIFTTAGLMAVDISDSDGNKAHDLGGDNAATLKFRIPESLNNPETGVPVKEGDVIPVWSRDDQTGQWSMEGPTATVQKDEVGLYVEHKTGHLSYWNLDWYGERCSYGTKRTLTFTAKDGSDFAMPVTEYGQSIMVVMNNDTRNYTRYGMLYDIENTLANTPSQGTTVFEAFLDYRKTVSLGKVTVTGCDNIALEIDTSKYPEPPPLFDLDIAVSFISKQEVNYWEAERLMIEAKVKRAKREEILNITHPGSKPEVRSWWPGDYAAYYARANRITFDDVYQDLLDAELMNREEIATVQSVQAMEFKLKDAQASIYIYSANWRSKYRFNGKLEDGLAKVKDIPLAEGDHISISSYGRIFDANDNTNTYLSGYTRITLTSEDIQRGTLTAKLENPYAAAVIYKALVNDTKIDD